MAFLTDRLSPLFDCPAPGNARFSKAAGSERPTVCGFPKWNSANAEPLYMFGVAHRGCQTETEKYLQYNIAKTGILNRSGEKAGNFFHQELLLPIDFGGHIHVRYRNSPCPGIIPVI